jgi:methyltransferase (TIGR00027 family)
VLDPVATTGLLVAAIRAEESAREDALFRDPFAAALAGDAGRAALAAYQAAAGAVTVPVIEVRTRFYDDAFRRAWQGGIRQFALLAAGMDARAYRLPWPDGTRLFEIDRPEVIALKAERLAGAEPTCQRVAIGMSLTEDWRAALRAAGFDPAIPTSFAVEGLLQYLDEATIEAIFAGIDQLASPRSHLLYDIVGRSLLESHPRGPARHARRPEKLSRRGDEALS